MIALRLPTTLAPAGRPARGGFFAAFAVWRQRRRLARLDTRALDDVGLTTDQARREAARPIWDVPAHWRA